MDQFPEREDEIVLDAAFEAADLSQLDWVGAEVRRDLIADRVRAISQDGDPLFVAVRARRVARRVMAVAAGFGVWFLGSTLAVGIGSVFAPQGSATGTATQDLIITFGMIASIFLAWGAGMYLTPVRPILLYEMSDPEGPRLVIGPTRRIRLSSLVLVVIDEVRGPIGYLKRERQSKIGWSGFDQTGRLCFHVDRRGGPTMGVRIFCWVIPPLGLAVALMSLFSRPTRPLALRTGDRKRVCGEIRPMKGLRGTTELCLDQDMHGTVDRGLGIAAMLAVTMHG